MRLIDADAIISFVDAGHLRNPLELAWSDIDVVDMIESRPTVDAVPVVHGEWKIGIDANGDPVTYCSNCKMPNYVQTNYCPDCGAMMMDHIADDGKMVKKGIKR